MENIEQVEPVGAIANTAEPADSPEIETPAVFLAKLAGKLKETDGVDGDLAAILTDHLLTADPHADCVVNAKAAIVKLAAKRAAPGGSAVAHD